MDSRSPLHAVYDSSLPHLRQTLSEESSPPNSRSGSASQTNSSRSDDDSAGNLFPGLGEQQISENDQLSSLSDSVGATGVGPNRLLSCDYCDDKCCTTTRVTFNHVELGVASGGSREAPNPNFHPVEGVEIRPPVGGLWSSRHFIEDARNFWRNDSAFPPTTEQRNFPVDSPFVNVFVDQKAYFTNTAISFMIHVGNLPVDFQVRPEMFHATVFSPTGKRLDPVVRRSNNSTLNLFVGRFRSTDEIGPYEVTVRIYQPVRQHQWIARRLNGVITADSTAFIMVNKNYREDAKQDCLRLKCIYGLSDQQTHAKTENGAPEPRQPSPQRPEQVSKLWGLTCNLHNNNLLYCDRESNLVYCMVPNGDLVFKFGNGTGTSPMAQLNRPTGICFDGRHNRLVICDKDNHRVCFFSLNGRFLGAFGERGHKNGMFDYPWDVAVAPNGNIVVTDSKNKRVQMFDRVGNYLNKYSVYEVNPFEYKTHFSYPRGIAVDDDGQSVYVTDFNVNNVIKLGMDFQRQEKLLPSGAVFRPQGLAVDPLGNLLVSDSRHDCMKLITSRGEQIQSIRAIVNEPIKYPVNVTTMAGGFIAVLTASGNITIF